MSIINIISDEKVTIVQGVNGISLCRESWINNEKYLKDELTDYWIFSASEKEEKEKHRNNDKP